MRGSPAAIGQLQWINGPLVHLHENVSDFIEMIKQFLHVGKANDNWTAYSLVVALICG